MNAAERYEKLESHRLRAQALGMVTEAVLETWLEKLDELWNEMDPAEREAANQRARAHASRPREHEIFVEDVAVRIGERRLPRGAA
jgi:hypothetical protein